VQSSTIYREGEGEGRIYALHKSQVITWTSFQSTSKTLFTSNSTLFMAVACTPVPMKCNNLILSMTVIDKNKLIINILKTI
jgi:hypothetical protein